MGSEAERRDCRVARRNFTSGRSQNLLMRAPETWNDILIAVLRARMRKL
jgi:hypothetical protein